jgi:very-long-chain (3R)-3-hydroxyacyl-CoA dehydratase
VQDLIPPSCVNLVDVPNLHADATRLNFEVFSMHGKESSCDPASRVSDILSFVGAVLGRVRVHLGLDGNVDKFVNNGASYAGFFISPGFVFNMTVARKAYLFVYNSLQWAGWIAILSDRISSLEHNQLTTEGTFFLYFFQSLAILEVIHAFTGVVRANPMTTLIQVASRLQLILVHSAVSSVSQSSGLIPMVLAWGMVEVFRYLYLAMNLCEAAPHWLLWSRYSLFYVLYPLGVYGEMRVLYDSLAELDQTQMFSIALPNVWNFSFSFSSYVRVLIYLVYLPGLYLQYTHMMRQRRKALYGDDHNK